MIPAWTVERGSALDEKYLESLGTFDVVYSWGVLHHTGQMWRALDLVQHRVSPNGCLMLALYNDAGGRSRRWRAIKKMYLAIPAPLRPAFAALAIAPIELRIAAGAVLVGPPDEQDIWRDAIRRPQARDEPMARYRGLGRRLSGRRRED